MMMTSVPSLSYAYVPFTHRQATQEGDTLVRWGYVFRVNGAPYADGSEACGSGVLQCNLFLFWKSSKLN